MNNIKEINRNISSKDRNNKVIESINKIHSFRDLFPAYQLESIDINKY
jgi:hypothetical protein